MLEISIMKIIIVTVLVLVVLVLFLLFTFKRFTETVNVGETGIKIKMGIVQDKVLTNGVYIKFPFIIDIVIIDNKILITRNDVKSISKDFQNVESTVSVNYRIPPEKSLYIYKNICSDLYSCRDIILDPAIKDTFKSVASKYTSKELISNRQTFINKIKEELTNKVQRYGIEITEVNIIDFKCKGLIAPSKN